MRKVSALQFPALVVVALLMAALLSVSVAAVIGGGAAPSLPSGTEGTPPYPSGSYGGLVTPGTPTIGVPPSPGCVQKPAPVCGNQIQEAGEQCDTSSTDAGFKVCADGTTATIRCIGCNFIQNPCGGCYRDTDCIDGNPCTLDTCVDNKCQQEPAPPDHVKAYSQTGQVLERCGPITVKKDPCGNKQIDPGETCASCSADVKCGSNQFCNAAGACQDRVCAPGATKNAQCVGCNQAKQDVCNAEGTGYAASFVKDLSCKVGCPCGSPSCITCDPVVPCSALGCGKTDSCGNSCGTCPPPPPPPPPPPTCSPYVCAVQGGVCIGSSCIIQEPPPSSCGNGQCDWFENCAGCPSDCGACPVVDPCANPDFSKSCCESKGFTWAKSGEGGSFGGFTGLGQEGCVGDDSNEYLRFRECEAGVCSTDAGDVAACSSPYSCVFEGKCYARLDKAADESAAVQGKIGESRGKEDKLSKLLQRLEELQKKAKEATSNKEKKRISKEIGSVMKDIDRLGGGISEQSQGVVSVPKPSGATSVLLCTPPVALAQG